MGDQNHRLFSRQTPDGRHDVVFALGVHIGGSFIEEVDGGIVQQSARHGKALPLPAGKVAAALVHGGLQAILTAAEVRKVHLFQRRPELALRRLWLCHAQVVFHRALKDGGIMGHNGQRALPRSPLQLLHRHAAHGHLPGIPGAAPRQQGGDGTFAAAGSAHQRDKAALRHGKGYVFQHGAAGLVAKGHFFQRQRGVRRGVLFAVLRLFCRQQTENFLCRSCTVHGNVEVAAQQPQRQEKVCRQQQNGQGGGQFQLSRRKGRHGADDTQPCAAVGHQVHQGDRVQLHGQHPHGDFAEALGFGVHLFVLPAVGLINFQGGQSLNVLQKAVAQRGVLAPVACQQLFGKLLHRHDGHGDQRHTAQQNDR